MMISQRPQKIHKDALTQIETLIAMRLVAPQDRHAVEDWIGAWADPKQGAELLSSLPSLETGEGWVWAPEVGVLKRVKFPRITTYDSSKAPDGDASDIVLAKIDLPGIQARLDTVANEAVENDPKRLRARIAELEKSKAAPDAAALEQARASGYASGRTDGLQEAAVAVQDGIEQARLGVEQALQALAGVTGDARSKPRPAAKTDVHLPAPKPRTVEATAPQSAPRVEGITTPQQRILDAMAKLESLGVERMTKGQAAAFAGASPKSSAFQNNVSRLRTQGLLDYPRPGDVALTRPGKAAASYPASPPTVIDLQAAWLRLLSAPQARILEAVIAAHPDSLAKTTLAERAGASSLSSAFQNNVSALRSLGLIDYPEKGFVVGTEIIVPNL